MNPALLAKLNAAIRDHLQQLPDDIQTHIATHGTLDPDCAANGLKRRAEHVAKLGSATWDKLGNGHGSLLLLSADCEPVERITTEDGTIVNVYAHLNGACPA